MLRAQSDHAAARAFFERAMGLATTNSGQSAPAMPLRGTDGGDSAVRRDRPLAADKALNAMQLANMLATYIGAAYWFTASTSFANHRCSGVDLYAAGSAPILIVWPLTVGRLCHEVQLARLLQLVDHRGDL